MVFAIPSRLFHRAPGLTNLTRTWYHLDYFIVHPDSPVICQDLQKPRHRDPPAGGTPTNQTAGPLGVMARAKKFTYNPRKLKFEYLNQSKMKPLRKVSTILLFIFLTQSIYSQDTAKIYNELNYGSNAEIGKYAEIRGFKMYYEIYGIGEPLLIIHGNGGSIGNFFNQIPFFSKNYKVILADSRSQGKSFDDGDSLSYEMMADDLNALLDYLKTDSCSVIGWSDGGINGLLLAMRHPKKVKKLAITGANLWPDTSAVESFAVNYAKNVYDSLSHLAPRSPEIKNNLKLIGLLINEPNIKTSQLGSITCPTLVIGGDHDVILPKHTLLIAESISKSYLWILPNSGHSTPISYKDQFNSVVFSFLKQPYRKISGLEHFN